jgi:chromosome segregation ATPase
LELSVVAQLSSSGEGIMSNDLDTVLNKLTSIDEKLDIVVSQLALVLSREKTLMALADDLQAAIAQLNTETNANAASIANVAALITSLASRITNSMTDQQVADIKAALTAQSALLTAEGTRLTTLAVDPTNPVPPTPPQLTKLRAAVKK